MTLYRVISQRDGYVAVQHGPYKTREECRAYIDGRWPARDDEPDEHGHYRVEHDTVVWIEESSA